MPWCFGRFQLDRENASLWDGAHRLALRPKTFELLVYLVEHAGALVSKETLLEAVWPDTVVAEGVLTTSIGELRKVLGETAKQPQCIATEHRRGYRFIAPVTMLTPAEVPPASLPVAPSPPRPCAVSSLPCLVGREAELAQLHQWWAQAWQGVRQVVFVTGEAGIGKTTLVDAFVAQVAAAGNVWVGRGQCIDQYGAGEAYLPLLEALGRLGRAPAGAHLVAVLQQQAPSWLLHLPALLTAAEAEALQHRVSGTTRERMLRELAEAIEVLTAEQPLVLVLEDLHWSDVSTLDWLARVAQRREAARLLVLGTYRPADAIVRAHPVRTAMHELLRHGQCAEVMVGELTQTDIAVYLGQDGPGRQLGMEVARFLHQRTGGNPLFLVQVVDALQRQGLLRQTGTGWEVVGDLEDGRHATKCTPGDRAANRPVHCSRSKHCWRRQVSWVPSLPRQRSLLG